MKKIFLGILCLQLIIIGVLWKNISDKKNVLGTISVNPIQSSWIISEKTGELEYFYELKPYSIAKPYPIFPGLENVTYTINEDGFNQKTSYKKNKDENIFRVVTIGDSHTFGQNVNTAENYPSQLQHMLSTSLVCEDIKTFEVINLGVYGYDIQYTVQRFNLKGLQYQPNLVVWLFVADDFKRINEKLFPKMRKYTNNAISTGEYDKQMKNGNYYAYWNKARDEVIQEIGGEKKLLTLQKDLLKSISASYSGKILLTSYSSLPSDYKKILSDFATSRPNTFYYENLPDIYSIPDAILPDLHPNKKGYTLISKSIFRYLINNTIVPCKEKKK